MMSFFQKSRDFRAQGALLLGGTWRAVAAGRLSILVLEHGKRNANERTKKKNATKETSLNVFSTRIVNDWNSLPKKVVDAISTDDFKSKLDDYWASEEYHTPF